MKKILLFFVAAIVTFQVVAQDRPTMHAILFADTDDESIGKGEEISLYKFNEFLSNVCNTINYEYFPDLYVGKYCRSSELTQKLQFFQCDSNDIIVFCYLGHGVRSEHDSSPFPQMCLHEKYQSNYVPLVNVSKSLAQHRARLTLVIGDCCNMADENVLPKESVIAPASKTTLSSATQSLMKELFVNTTGVITMCATKKGTYGWSNQETGSYFVNSLIQAINETPLRAIKPDKPWDSVMDVVMKDLGTKNFCDKNDPSKIHKMYPVYIIEPRFEKQIQRREGEINPREDISQETKLQQTISDIANVNIPKEQRKAYVQKLLSDFAPKAMIRTVSADGKVPFTLYDAREYFDKMLYYKYILNINIKNVIKNQSGKITLLEIHEVYSEIN